MKYAEQFLKFANRIDAKGYDLEADQITDLFAQYIKLSQMNYNVVTAPTGGSSLTDANGNPIKPYSGGKLESNQITSFALDPGEIEKFQSKVGPDSPPFIITSKDGQRNLFVHSSSNENGEKIYTVEPGRQVNQTQWEQYKNEKGWTGIKEITCYGGASTDSNTITGNIGKTQAAIDPNTNSLLINPES